MTRHEADMLIDRLVTNDASETDWSRFQELALDDPALWEVLAVTQRDAIQLQQLTQDATRHAERIEIGKATALNESLQAPEVTAPVRSNGSAWSGWAVAAMLLLTVLIAQFVPSSQLPDGANDNANLATLSTPLGALDHYLTVGREKGTVVDELPTRVLLDKRPLPDGSGYEVLFIRQIIEKTTVPDLYYQDGEDEHGQPSLVRYTQPVNNTY